MTGKIMKRKQNGCGLDVPAPGYLKLKSASLFDKLKRDGKFMSPERRARFVEAFCAAVREETYPNG